MEYRGFSWNPGYQLKSAQLTKEMRRIDDPDHLVQMSPDRFLSSIFEDPGRREKNIEKSTNIHLSSRLPVWLCNIIATALGTGRDHSDNVRPRNSRAIISTALHMMTLLSGLSFGVCGLYFNVYDTLSTLTKTTVLVSVSKCVVGLSWILLGIYSHSLAARLINNPRVVDCIRLHSKTFMKINMVFVVAFLMTCVLIVNLYANKYLLDPSPHTDNSTRVYDANCASIGVTITLCRIYYASKVVYSCLSLCWNLMVVAISLSICRTLTIGIRRFIRELNFDSHIYEEYQMTRYYLNPAGVFSPDSGIEESWTIWDDDIKAFDDDPVFQLPSSRENVLRDMRSIRRSISGQDSLKEVIVGARPDHMSDYNRKVWDCQERHRERQRVISGGSIPEYGIPSYPEYGIPSYPECIEGDEAAQGKGDHHPNHPHPHHQDVPSGRHNRLTSINGESSHEEVSVCSKHHEGPPIISNEDLMFTYFKLMRRLSSTSRLLQRWMSSWITFVLLWCITLVIYWVSHVATITDLLEFLLPVFAIGFMTSAYAEVNFEGGRVLKSLLPLDVRMPVIYYIQNAGLELKIFSFVMTYNVLVTVLTGVALTIASRIIIDQIT